VINGEINLAFEEILRDADLVATGIGGDRIADRAITTTTIIIPNTKASLHAQCQQE